MLHAVSVVLVKKKMKNDMLNFCLFVLAIDSLLSMAIYNILTTLDISIAQFSTKKIIQD